MGMRLDESSTESILVQYMGYEKAQEFAAIYGGEKRYIPKRIKLDRDDVIKQEFGDLISQGATCMSSYRQLSQKHGLSTHRIMEIVNSAA
jgi:hypothetical protein